MPTRDEQMEIRRALEARASKPEAHGPTEHDLIRELGVLHEQTIHRLARVAILLAEAEDNNARLKEIIEALRRNHTPN